MPQKRTTDKRTVLSVLKEAGTIDSHTKPEYTRTSASIMMLQILYSRDLVSISELARLLGTNPRNIPEYKKELQYAGYLIDSVPGRYGGYRLVKQALFPSVKLEKAEQEALLRGFDYLLKRNDFLEKDSFGKAIAKISSAAVRSEQKDNTLIANRFPLAMPEEELTERYSAFSLCITSKREIEIEYLSTKNTVTKWFFHPFKLFMYNNAWCVLGQYRDSERVIYLKLNRVQKFSVTGNKFRIPLTYKESDYLDEYGMKQNGEWYPIKLKLTGPYAMLVKERIYGKEQTAEAVDENTSILSVSMQNIEAIKGFVLGFGTNCEVLEPLWLREKIMKEAEEIASGYKSDADNSSSNETK